MKKVIFILLGVFWVYQGYAQDKCDCDLVAGYSAPENEYDSSAEQLLYVPAGKELWVEMPVAHRRNKKENGGCRLQAGDGYIADLSGKPLRAAECGNGISRYEWLQVENSTKDNNDRNTAPRQQNSKNKVSAPIFVPTVDEQSTVGVVVHKDPVQAPIARPSVSTIPQRQTAVNTRSISNGSSGYRIQYIQEKQPWWYDDGKFLWWGTTNGNATLGYIALGSALVGGTIWGINRYNNRNNPSATNYENGPIGGTTTNGNNGHIGGTTGDMVIEQPIGSSLINIGFRLSF